MDHVGTVHGLESAKGLIREILTMVVRQLLGTDDSMQVGLHELLNQVHLGERFIGAGFDNVEDADDVFRDVAFLKEAQ